MNGTWVTIADGKAYIITFPSASQIKFLGNLLPCKIEKTVLKIKANQKWLTVPFHIRGDTLELTSDGKQTLYQRIHSPREALPADADREAIIRDLIRSEWIDNSTENPISLAFPSKNTIRFDGEERPCTITAERITFHGKSGWIKLIYRITGDLIDMVSPHGYEMVLHRKTPASSASMPKKTSMLFAHRYCSSKGSSNEWIQLQKDGTFRFGSRANRIVTASGTYTVQGDTVTVTIKGEDFDPMHIIRKNHDGMIETMEFDGTVYDVNICRKDER